MKPYLVLPLTDDQGESKKLRDILADLIPEHRFSLKGEYFKDHNFVLFDGTPSELSAKILDANNDEVILHVILSAGASNIAGYGPNDFVQWITHHGE